MLAFDVVSARARAQVNVHELTGSVKAKHDTKAIHQQGNIGVCETHRI
jgi:hypothetical protein